MSARFVIGIDLGTTHCCLAYAPLTGNRAEVQVLPIPQLVAAGVVEARPLLPSFLYLPTPDELASGTCQLPWPSQGAHVVGEFARRQSADVPQRTISAAKSWLCHSRVNRRDPILPWQAPEGVPGLSPVTVTQRYLEHLVAAWQAAQPEAPFAEQQVVLTVPASFDASARELTREAALAAGLPENLVLLEEPQAAVYAWLNEQGDLWRKKLQQGDSLLVCDVGGGTTDFTLIAVDSCEGELSLRRVAVGNHLLVGGDNMDLALAHYVAGKLAEQGTQLDAWQSVSLWHACRHAKETVLTAGGPEQHTVSVLGRGSRLLKGALRVELRREALVELLQEGFFPRVEIHERPARRRASGFQEIGLPFESDSAITRHLAHFLASQGSEAAAVRPTRLLFNGGVFKSPVFQHRLREVLGKWFGNPPERLPGHENLDFAVAQGAACYGFAKLRGGVRIRGGAARSYYVGIESAGLAVPGAARPLRALCVLPQGLEEGSRIDVPSPDIGLVVGEPAQFRFFSSTARKQDRAGDLVTSWAEGELQETAPLEANLPAHEASEEGYVPVRFQSHLTELGTFELWCQHARQNGRWKLEFSVREED